MREMF